jgi:hypothetical protein
MRGDISVSISTGVEATYFAVTNDHQLMVHHEYMPKMGVSIKLGRCTVRQIERMQECLERLKIHAVEN